MLCPACFQGSKKYAYNLEFNKAARLQSSHGRSPFNGSCLMNYNRMFCLHTVPRRSWDRGTREKYCKSLGMYIHDNSVTAICSRYDANQLPEI